MISTAINRRVSSCAVILYRRVSTKKQSKREYRNQLDVIKSVYPDFSISHSCIENITEHVSGLADPEIRMASGLGKALRLLQRNPFAIILVSNIDRIARRPDIFELIQRQSLGHRIFDVSTGLCLDQVVESGDHIKIHKETKAQHTARLDGIKRYQAAGGTMGSPDIGNRSKQAAATSRQLAKDRQSEVLHVVKQMVIDGRGHMPPYRDICDEMNERGLRTGQGRFHTPQRLSQLRKYDPVAWDYARDSYHRPRRWLRSRLTVAFAEAKAEAQARAQTAGKPYHHQDRRQPMKKPALISYRRVNGLHVACVATTVVKNHSSRVYDPRRKQTGCDGCRGPPQERVLSITEGENDPWCSPPRSLSIKPSFYAHGQRLQESYRSGYKNCASNPSISKTTDVRFWTPFCGMMFGGFIIGGDNRETVWVCPHIHGGSTQRYRRSDRRTAGT